jgi:hypothetical protein
MPKNEAQKQKKLAKKKSRDNEKRKIAAQQKNRMTSFAGQWKSALSGPFGRVWIGEDFRDIGMGQLIVTRRLFDGRVAVVRFLIDSYCLGVKDVVVSFEHSSEVEDLISALQARGQTWVLVMPADAAKIVLGAVEYARNLGLEPHPTYAKVAEIFHGVDVAGATFEIEFGRGGKPVYISGPNESPQRFREIQDKVRASGNELELDYTALLSEYDALDDPDLDEDLDQDLYQHLDEDLDQDIDEDLDEDLHDDTLSSIHNEAKSVVSHPSKDNG